MYYTYGHYRKSDNKLFYIGKGKGRRAYDHVGRNAHWCSIVDKHDLKVEILAHWKTEQEAFEHERFLISCFRDDLGFKLANYTDGGEGSSGFVHPPEMRAKHLIALEKVNANLSTEIRSEAAKKGWTLDRKIKAGIVMSEVAQRPGVSESKSKASTASNYARWADPEYKKRVSEAMRGKKKTMSEAAINARRLNSLSRKRTQHVETIIQNGVNHD